MAAKESGNAPLQSERTHDGTAQAHLLPPGYLWLSTQSGALLPMHASEEHAPKNTKYIEGNLPLFTPQKSCHFRGVTAVINLRPVIRTGPGAPPGLGLQPLGAGTLSFWGQAGQCCCSGGSGPSRARGRQGHLQRERGRGSRLYVITGDRSGNSRAKPIPAEFSITEVSSLGQLPVQGRATPALMLGRRSPPSARSPVESHALLPPPYTCRGRVASSVLLRARGSCESRVSDPSHAA